MRGPRLVVHEIYRSIQGESTRAGLPCVFVRLAGCDLRCAYCDTENAPAHSARMAISEIVREVERYSTRLVEVTGGEPLLQADVHLLLRELVDRGDTVLLETSGAHDISACDPRVVRILDLKTPSSGEMHRMRWENLGHLRAADEIKFVIGDWTDFSWALNVTRERGLLRTCPVLFSPVWNVLPAATLAEWVRECGLPIRFQPQLHKLLWGPIPST